uniref:BHLH domain-containing protein n=1 Tax=Kalanchoe fedtschenkoi TaxID=63787 RepID=A0A7N0TG05_KALFE
MAASKDTSSFDATSVPEEGLHVANMMASSTTNSFEENMKFPGEEFSHSSHKLGFGIMDNHYYASNSSADNLMQEVLCDSNQDPAGDQMSWNAHGVNEMQNGHRGFHVPNLQDHPYPATHELLDLFNLPSSLGFLGDHTQPENMPASANLYDPLYQMSPPPQQPSIRELIQSTLPRCCNFSGLNGSLYGGEDERDVVGGAYQDLEGRDFDSEVLEFTGEKPRKGKGKEGNATERKRRVEFSGKYDALKSLLPSPNKPDRASIVGEAIDYIKELKRTVSELKSLVEKKKCGKERNKKPKTEEDGFGDYNGSLRCSWLQRKSKDAEVDVRIIDDEVTIKLVQRKRINCLLLVTKILDELQLDLQHVAGGHAGDFYSFLFNTKIYEGSYVYATGIANRLLEAVERQYAAVPPSSKY